MRYLFLIATVIFFGCDSYQRSGVTSTGGITNNSCHIYPTIIDSLNIQDLYDSTRWYLYTQYCDILYKPKRDSVTSKPFGEMELQFHDIFIRNDTVVLFFNFVDSGRSIVAGMTRDNRQLANGISYDIKTKRKLYVVSSNMNIVTKNNPSSRYENPLQPEVIRYIKENRKKLNICFRELADKKGINE